MNSNPTGAADPLKVREFWVETVRGAADRGKLETIPTVKARTPREQAQAKSQNFWLTRRTIGGFGANYDLIDWKRTASACDCGDAA